MTTTPHISEVCNRLLQGERSAVQSYGRILKRFGTDPRSEPLKFIKAQHEASLQELELIASPSNSLVEFDPGSWALSPESVDDVTSLFCERAAIDYLLNGERTLKSDYEGVISGSVFRDPLLHSLFSIVLLPRSQRHVVALDRLKALFGRTPSVASMERTSVYPWAAAPAHWN